MAQQSVEPPQPVLPAHYSTAQRAIYYKILGRAIFFQYFLTELGYHHHVISGYPILSLVMAVPHLHHIIRRVDEYKIHGPGNSISMLKFVLFHKRLEFNIVQYADRKHCTFQQKERSLSDVWNIQEIHWYQIIHQFLLSIYSCPQHQCRRTAWITFFQLQPRFSHSSTA